MTSVSAVYATPEPEGECLQSPENFIQTLYGTDPPGFCNVWTLPGEKSHFIQADLPAVVAKTALQLATNHDVYLGLGLLREPLPGGRRGCKEDVIGIPGFWADLDIKGPGHKQTALPETQKQAIELAYALPWDPTMIVFSGGGIYCFSLFKEPWVFECDDERDQAAMLSSGFQAMLIAEGHKRGWVIDNTSDLARVLRIPGTFNRKQKTPAPVRVIEYHPDRRYLASDFEKYIYKDSGGRRTRNKGRKDDPSDYSAAYIEKIVAECPWMRHCRDNGASLPEPEWYSMLSIVGRCENGPRIAHDWSQRYPGYSRTETDKKLNHALADGGPRTCENIKLNGGAPYCDNCPNLNRTTSPIILGRLEKTSDEHQSRPWPEARELPPLLPNAPTLPAEMLPGGLRLWLEDIAERLQVPLEVPASAALVGFSAVVGRNLGIYPKRRDDWLVIPNLWGDVVGRPGILKSAAATEALKPLGSLAAQARCEFERLQAQNQAADFGRKARIEGIKELMKKAAKGRDEGEFQTLQAELSRLLEADAQTPTERRYRVNDSTVEKLIELLKQNPRGLLIYRDELSGWLRSLDKAGRETDRAFFLECWNGDGEFTQDRISRGSVHSGLCISMFGTIQPGKLSAYVEAAIKGGQGDDGLIQRFQIAVYPEQTKTWSNCDRYPNHEARERAYRIFSIVDRLDPATYGIIPAKFGRVPALRFEPDAQDFFDEWRLKLETRLRSGEIESSTYVDHLGKFRSLMPSIALLTHLADWGDAQICMVPPPGLEPVSLRSAQLGAAWCDYLETHARKLFAGAINPDLQAAHALAAKIRQRKVHDGMSVREIYRNSWSGLATKDAVYGGLSTLQELGWVRIVSVKKREGTVTDEVRLNPSLRGKSNERVA
jgi:putative DNA primase/helicase